jgi:hypothetical protein
MTNPNQKIVEDAWARLWNQVKYPNYYLPTAILNGIQANGIIVSPLGNLELTQLGPFAMFSEPVLGSISLVFNSNTINGLQTMSNQGIVVSTDGLSFTATVGVQALAVSGDFEVEATGLSVCAVDSVWALGQIFDRDAAATSPNPDDDPGIRQAKSYRAKLLAQGPNGQMLVGTYYDNNDVYNDIANDPTTAFNYNWAYYKTPGLDQHGNPVTVDSKILSAQTTSAAQDPSNAGQVVGYDAYSKHSFTGQGLMIKSLNHKIDELLAPYQGKSVPPAVKAQVDRLTEAQLATFKFGDHAKVVDGANPNGMTVDSVMTSVQTGTPQMLSPSAEIFASEGSLVAVAEAENGNDAFRYGMKRAQELADAFYGRPQREALVKAQDSTPVHGTYTLSVPVPTMSISGTIGIDGGKLSVTITNVSSSSPSLTYNLDPADGGSDLFKKVVDHYISASYIHQLCQQKANDALNSDQLKSYMTDRINQSINQIFG